MYKTCLSLNAFLLALTGCGGGQLTILSPANAKSLETAEAKACMGGDGAACYRAGQATDYTGNRKADAVPKTGNDAPASARLYEKGCALEHGASCNAYAELAFGYESGVFDGSEGDRMKAAYAHYYKACTLGVGEACESAGYMVKEDDMYPATDLNLLFELETKGCTLGHKGSCFGAVTMIKNNQVTVAPEVAADLQRRWQELKDAAAPAPAQPPATP